MPVAKFTSPDVLFAQLILLMWRLAHDYSLKVRTEAELGFFVSNIGAPFRLTLRVVICTFCLTRTFNDLQGGVVSNLH